MNKMNKIDKLGEYDFKSHMANFFVLIGILFPMFMIGAYIAGKHNIESWGYYVSHNIYICAIVFVLLLIAIFILYKNPECFKDGETNKIE